MSLDHTGESTSIPFLDNSVSIGPDGSIWTELFVNPSHSGVLLHYRSTQPETNKRAVAAMQMKRAVAVANTREGAERGADRMSDMLACNDYPKETIQRARRRAYRASVPAPGGPHQKRDNQDGVLALPYVSETVTHQVRKALRKSGLNVRIAQRSGPTLRSVFTASALERPQCPGCRDCLACLAGLQGKCGTKNVVYRLVCALCHSAQ